MNIIKNNFRMLKYLWIASPERIFFAILNAIITALEPLLTILTVKFLFDAIMQGKSFHDILMLIAIFAIIYTSIALFSSWYRNNLCKKSNLKVQKYIQNLIYKKIRKIDLKAFDDNKFYQIFTRAVNESERRAISVFDNFINFLRNIISLIGVASVLLILEPGIILITLAGIALNMFISTISNKIQYKYDMGSTEFVRKKDYVKRVFYLQQYSKEIKLFKFAHFLIELYNKSVESLNNLIDNYKNKFSRYDFLQNMSQVIVVLTTMSFLSWKIINNSISIGDFAALLNGSQEFANILRSIFSFYPTLIKNSLYIDNFFAFINYKNEANTETGILVNSNEVDIKIENVSFKYSNNDNLIIDKINLHIKNREKIAIVGKNGAGKSTLAKLLLKLYDPTEGDIYLNNIKYKDYNINSLRSNFGAAFQDFQYYSATIAENILMRKVEDKADEELVWDALHKSGLIEKVKNLKNGINTILTKEFCEEGTLLSGGEVQKLVIARVYARKCNFVILDEPSSFLDPISENELNTRMLTIFKNETVILISHRLSTVCNADRILLLENGSITEAGTHQELMKLNKKYADMFNMQAKNYIRKTNSEELNYPNN
ncbi:MAG: ABC transporter ATP-binding protein/permease [Halanaerobiales bacterium]|nr:ABC transporter ATP-binding protein/permease [Halanaerobiales bacterium]